MAEPNFSQLLYTNLERLERIVLALLIIIVGARSFGLLSSFAPLKFGPLALSAVYFLFAFRPPPPIPEGTNLDFVVLLVAVIVPKVLWISSSVGVVGLTFYFGEMPGAQQLILIQTSTAAVCLVIWGIGSVLKTPTIERVSAPMTRAIPIMLLGAYILLK